MRLLPRSCISFVIFLMILAFSSAARRMRPYLARFPSAGLCSTTAAPAPSHSAFRLLNDEFVDEYQLRALTYVHKNSGAHILSVICTDENKVFGITFPTPVADSTGLPHVLEHSVLCGSRKYPTKEPFVHLLKGSLNTFLNAFTYPDRTCYPVASMNSKDFYNLIDVYLDAVFYPRAITDPRVLAQEGWHYSMDDPESPLVYKGVVYNEMKGVYSSPEAVLSRATQHALFPDTSYGHDSGGSPESIPDMTFESFTRFHSAHYHPSKSKIFFYGDDDPAIRLQILDEYLKEFSLDRPQSEFVEPVVQYQRRFTEPKIVNMEYPTASVDEKKHMYTLNWVINEHPMDQKERLAMSVLNHLMFATADSVMRKTLMESLLGDGIIADYSDELLQKTLEVGMKGVPEENVGSLRSLILDTLSRLALEGFEDSAVQASMNSVEFHLREFNTGGYPKGLSVMLGVMPDWIYRNDPVVAIRFEKVLAELKSDIAAEIPVFQNLIKKYLIENTHRAEVNMRPDAEFESKRQAAEDARLASIRAEMGPNDIAAVVEATRALLDAQAADDSPEAKATLPRLDLSDIDKNISEIPIVIEELPGNVLSSGAMTRSENSKLLYHVLPTNGILYANIVVDIADVSTEDLELLPLFSRMITQTGTAKLDSVALSRKIGTETGGIGASYHSSIRQRSGVVSDPSDALLYFVLSGKSVTDKVPQLLEIFEDVLCNARLDNQQRAVEMLKQSKASRESSVISSGHSYAATRLGARYSVLGYYREVTSGLTYARALDRLLEQASNDWEVFRRRLFSIRDIIMRNYLTSVIVNLTGNDQVIKVAKPLFGEFLDRVAEISVSAARSESYVHTGTPFLPQWDQSKLFPLVNEGFSIPSQVNYVVKGGTMLEPGEPVRGSFAVAARFLNTGYLWDTVRVQGGAYGGSGSFGAVSGRYLFSSYRDPNIAKTLNAYDEASDSIVSESLILTKEDVLEAIIGAIGDLDSPQSPDQKGYTSLTEFLHGGSAADRQQWRDEILATTSNDFKDFGDRLSALKQKGTVVVFGSNAALESANQELYDANRLLIEPAFPSLSPDNSS